MSKSNVGKPAFKPESFQQRVREMGHRIVEYTDPEAFIINGENEEGFKILLGLMTREKAQYDVSERTSNFWKFQTPEEIEKVYAAAYHIATGSHNDPRLIHVEAKEYAKCGPYVCDSFHERSTHLLKYFGREADFDIATLAPYIEQVANELLAVLGSRPDLLPVTGEDGAYALMTKGTNFGAPYHTKQWSDPDYSEHAQIVLDLLKVASSFGEDDGETYDRISRLPSTIYHRTVPDGRDVSRSAKKRCTFAPHKYEALLGKRVSHLILRAFAQTEWGSGYGGNHICGPIIQRGVADSDHVLSLDYSGYDQTCKKKVREVTLRILQIVFDESAHTFIERLCSLHEEVRINTPFGIVVVDPLSDHIIGLQSGLAFTGIYATLWNRVMALKLQSAAIDAGFKLDNFVHLGYGDDTILSWRGDKLPMSFVVNELAYFGMEINEGKQEYASGTDRYGVFLQKYYFFAPSGSDLHSTSSNRDDVLHIDGGLVTRGVHSLCRSIPRLLYKDFTSESEMALVTSAKQGLTWDQQQMVETISSLEECIYHPCATEFVRFVAANHPLKLATWEFLDWRKIRARAMNAGIDPERGIETFKTVNMLKMWEVTDYKVDHNEIAPVPEFRNDGTVIRGMVTSLRVEWWSHKLRKFDAKALWEHKIVHTPDQLRQGLYGQKIKWTLEQQRWMQAIGLGKRIPIEVRVRNEECRHGVRLLPHQVRALNEGRSYEWTNDQRRLKEKWGQMSRTDQDAIIASWPPVTNVKLQVPAQAVRTPEFYTEFVEHELYIMGVRIKNYVGTEAAQRVDAYYVGNVHSLDIPVVPHRGLTPELLEEMRPF